MKYLIGIVRILVAVLFIFSGLVKANDPLGLSYKMEEFFNLWGWTALNSYTLALSVLIIAFEIIAGIAVLVGWRFRLFAWLLLLLILFFTFLTGYAYLSGKFTDCGCFGDCLPITPLTSFTKDIILLILILFLVFVRNRIRPLFRPRLAMWIVIIGGILSFAFQWYVLHFLPVVDCLAFKKGNHIPTLMKPPPDAKPDSTVMRFIYLRKSDSTKVEFDLNETPTDTNKYKFIDRIDKVVRKGNMMPAIKGFVLNDTAKTDHTQEVLSDPMAVLVFVEDIRNFGQHALSKCISVYEPAREKHIPFYFITLDIGKLKEKLKGSLLEAVPVFSCDFTAIRTAARTSPCYYLLQGGTVINKWSNKTLFGLRYRLEQAKPLTPQPPVEMQDSLNMTGPNTDTIPAL